MNNREVGSVYEEIAASELEKQGYRIIEKNFYTRVGEIDIIAKDEEYLCFVEVKYRMDDRDGDPLEAVDERKIKKICKSAMFYLLKNGYPEATPVRFDVVAILGEDIRLIKNAFEYI